MLRHHGGAPPTAAAHLLVGADTGKCGPAVVARQLHLHAVVAVLLQGLAQLQEPAQEGGWVE